MSNSGGVIASSRVGETYWPLWKPWVYSTRISYVEVYTSRIDSERKDIDSTRTSTSVEVPGKASETEPGAIMYWPSTLKSLPSIAFSSSGTSSKS